MDSGVGLTEGPIATTGHQTLRGVRAPNQQKAKSGGGNRRRIIQTSQRPTAKTRQGGSGRLDKDVPCGKVRGPDTDFGGVEPSGSSNHRNHVRGEKEPRTYNLNSHTKKMKILKKKKIDPGMGVRRGSRSRKPLQLNKQVGKR